MMPLNPSRWPAEYQAVACSEGWDLFTTDGAATETYRNDQFARQTSYLLVRGRKARGAQRLLVDKLFLAR